jgi:hypothetical protein
MLKGASLGEAHRYWDHGTNVWAAIQARQRFTHLSVAKLLVTFAAIAEGPLIQQASTTSTRTMLRTLPLEVDYAMDLPLRNTANITG